MKVEQQETTFKPITITLETRKEAKAFFNLIYKIEQNHCHEGEDILVDDDEAGLVVMIQNALTEKALQI